MHVPKAGGTELMQEMERFLRPKVRVGGWDRSMTGGFEDFDSMASNVREAIRVDLQEFPADVDMIAGHFSRHSLQMRYPDINLMTVLREPKSRLLSNWYYFRNYTEETIRGYGGFGAYISEAKKTFVEYLSFAPMACQNDNLIVRLLLWPNELIPIDGFIDEANDDELVESALQEILKFQFFDCLENRDLKVNLFNWLKGIYGRSVWEPLEHMIAGDVVINRNEAKPYWKTDQFDIISNISEARPMLDHLTRLDAKLWIKVATMRIGEDFVGNDGIKYFDEVISRYQNLSAN